MKRIFGLFIEGTIVTLLTGPVGFGIWFACYALYFVALVLAEHKLRVERTRNHNQ